MNPIKVGAIICLVLCFLVICIGVAVWFMEMPFIARLGLSIYAIGGGSAFAALLIDILKDDF